MPPDPAIAEARWRWLTRTLFVLAFTAICLGPHLHRLRHPSLFMDDVARIKDLQTKPLRALLFRPFEEHMAPVFEIVSGTTWQLAGKRLSNAPLAFTMMSYLPFLLCLWLLALVLHRELGSSTTALVGVAAFSLSSLHSETIYWYSASSFTWALALTLVSLLCAGRAARKGESYALAGSAVASALAPACSAIGLLAGPLGTLRLALSVDLPQRRTPRTLAVVPLIGTVLYLLLCSAFRYQDVLAGSFEKRADFASGMPYALCAPTNVLLPGLFGLPPVDLSPAVGQSLGLSILALAGILVWARRSRHRALILGGLWLIAGGYVMTYCFRTQRFGARWLFNVERYHLFPLLGFTFWVALVLRPWLRRYDGRPRRAWIVATGLAVLLMLAHLNTILLHSRFYHFPTQPQTLAAVERLDHIARRGQITRDQIGAALGRISLRWGNPLDLLPASREAPVVAETRVRPLLLAAMSPADREALWGGMDVSPYLRLDEHAEEHVSVAVGRFVKSYRVLAWGTGRCLPAGWPSFLEFEIAHDSPGSASAMSQEEPPPSALCVPGGTSGPPMEVWWAASEDEWSETRSVRWQPRLARVAAGWSVSLDRLPHWDPARVRLIRFVFRTATTTTIGEPRLLR